MAEGKRNAFSAFHPAVNFIFFLGAIGFCAAVQHPAYLAAGIFAAGVYFFLLYGRKGAKILPGLLAISVIVTVLNPLFNTQGDMVLFLLFGRPFTLEALFYGAAVGGMLLSMMLWFFCYSAVMTGEKFTALFGNLAPALSLLLVMIFRMAPALVRKGQKIIVARKAVGKGISGRGKFTHKAREGLSVLGCLTAWSLEGSVVTADSMRCRGYGSGKRTSFMLTRMTFRDWLLLAVMAAFAAVFLTFAFMGSTAAEYTPELSLAGLEGARLCGFAAYCLYLMIPVGVHVEEAVKWRAWR